MCRYTKALEALTKERKRLMLRSKETKGILDTVSERLKIANEVCVCVCACEGVCVCVCVCVCRYMEASRTAKVYLPVSPVPLPPRPPSSPPHPLVL